MEHIFDRFVTVDSQGSGLGLSICREIATQMGGRITIKSEEGVGTIVWVTIPCKVIELERK
jgi:signal transduction histidine kinase